MNFVSKRDSKLMSLIGWFCPSFLDYWTTIGKTIYYPPNIKNPDNPAWSLIIEHEKVHMKQYQKYGIVLFLFLYLFIPLPVFFAYFRWKFEREAYLIEIKNGLSSRFVVKMLDEGYLKPWPKSWMVRWFDKRK